MFFSIFFIFQRKFLNRIEHFTIINILLEKIYLKICIFIE